MPESARDEAATEAGEAAAAGRWGRLKRLFHWRLWINVPTIACALVLSVLFHSLYLLGTGEGDDAPAPPAEITLGSFRFEPDPAEATPVDRAHFRLHISLLDEVDEQTREQLATHRMRVQQNIEQLLRQAHGGDFVDPTLTELKRRLQERINETLAVRGIAEVIVTDLELQFRADAGEGPEESSGIASR